MQSETVTNQVEYLEFLMDALEEAYDSTNYEITVWNGTFEIKDTCYDTFDNSAVLSPLFNKSNYSSAVLFRTRIKEKREARMKKVSTEEIRKVALSKLTLEEQEALGW